MRLPLGGLMFHHIQYLVGLHKMGHRVIYFEDFGWENSCYDLTQQSYSADPTSGIDAVLRFLAGQGINLEWCFLHEDGRTSGLTRSQLRSRCSDADLYLNLSGINWIPELELCGRRVLVDTDPVFVQIGGHGMFNELSYYNRLFTYGENVHRQDCQMPTANQTWIGTRQPSVLDLWPRCPPNPEAPYSTVMSWSAYGDREHNGVTYGQKNRQFRPYFNLPRQYAARFLVAMNGPEEIAMELRQQNWEVISAAAPSESPASYQKFIRDSKAEFSVAKHGYVATNSGWFSDRSVGYLSMGRPVLVEDTGFSENFACGQGIVPFRSREDVLAGLVDIDENYLTHCEAAYEMARTHFNHEKVLSRLIEQSF